MTPKENAKDLVDKFYDTTPNEAFIDEPLVLSTPYSSWGQAKQCAIIAVDEVLNLVCAMDGKDYWQSYYEEVKQEIELL